MHEDIHGFYNSKTFVFFVNFVVQKICENLC